MKLPPNLEVYTTAGKFNVTSNPTGYSNSYAIVCRDSEFEREVHHYLNILVPGKKDYEMKALVFSDNNEAGDFETQALHIEIVFEPFNNCFVEADGDDRGVFNFNEFIDDLIQSGQLDDLLKSRRNGKNNKGEI